MENKGIFKLKAGTKERSMHYINENGKLYALTLNDSKKIEDIKENNNISLRMDPKSEESIHATVDIIDDSEQVTGVFNKMLEQNHTHFKEFDDRIVLLDIMRTNI